METIRESAAEFEFDTLSQRSLRLESEVRAEIASALGELGVNEAIDGEALEHVTDMAMSGPDAFRVLWADSQSGGHLERASAALHRAALLRQHRAKLEQRIGELDEELGELNRPQAAD